MNLTVVAVFIAWNRSSRARLVLLVPLLVELYVFILGIALILATLFVRLRDIGQVWELAAHTALLRDSDHLSGRVPAPRGRRR